MTDRLLRAAPAVLFALLAGWLLWPAVIGAEVLSGGDLLLFQSPFEPPPGLGRPSNPLLFDSAYVFQPDQLQVREALREGRLPLWTPELSAGRPLLAAQQSAPLYPLNWVAAVLPYWESLGLVAALKLIVAGGGTYLFCRTLGLSTAAALLGAVSFAFGTYMVTWLSHPHVNAYALLPWLFLFAERLCRRGRPADALGLGAVLGLALLGGHPQSALIVALPVAGWVALRLAARGGPRGESLRWAALAAGGAALGLALGAVMLVPLVEALSQSYDTSRSAPPLAGRAGLALLFPEHWGRPDKFVLAGEPVNFQERTAYAGALPVLLALAGLARRRPAPAQLFFAAVALLALACAFNSGPPADLARELPVLSLVDLNRTLVLFAFSASLLAAYGLERALRGGAGERRRMALAAAAAALVPALAWIAANPGALSSLGDALAELPQLGETPAPAEAVKLASVLRWVLIGGLGATLLGALAWGRLRPGWAAAAVVGLAALELVALNRGYQPSVDKERAAPAAPPAVELLRRRAGRGRIAAEGEALGPNVAQRFGLSDARGHELPVVERHQRLWQALGGAGYQRTLLEGAVPGRLLDLLGVRYAISPGLAERGYPVVLERDGVRVVRNPTALPRAWVAHGWRPASSFEEALAATAASETPSLRDEPVVEGAPPPPEDAGTASPARLVEQSDTSTTLEVDARAPGMLVLGDTHYPGWSAEVDGREAEIRAANAAFRAVEVPRGRHEVRFRYRPASVTAGAAISLAALLALLAGVALSARACRRSRYRPTP